MDADCIILGQGISGTLLSHELIKQGKKVIVIDEPSAYTASRVSRGIINPVTGQRMVRSAEFEQFLGVAMATYKELETMLGMTLIKPYSILNFHRTQTARDLFEEKAATDKNYLHGTDNEEAWKEYFRFDHGIGTISPAWLIDVHSLLNEWRKMLSGNGWLWEEKFDWSDCTVAQHHVTYKGITAHKIICCEGVAGKNNPYFSRLPFSDNKGEIIIASIPGLPRTHLYKQDIFILPWMDDLFWVGPSSEWKYDDLQPTAAFRDMITFKLDNWLKLPYRIVDHWVSQRPTTVDRKPLVRFHAQYPSVGILNGMGSKGSLQGPYYAQQLTAMID